MVQLIYNVKNIDILHRDQDTVPDGILYDGKFPSKTERYIWEFAPEQQRSRWKGLFAACPQERVIIRLSGSILEDAQKKSVPLSFDKCMEMLIRAAESCGREELMVLFPSTGIPLDQLRCLISLFNIFAADSTLLCRTGVEIADPQAALMAEEYAKIADFIIFQTEELTKTMYAIANGDARRVVCKYMQDGIFEQSPFCTFDSVGLGTLLLFAICQANTVKQGICFGAAGKPIEEPQGQKFCRENGIGWMLFDAPAA